MTSYEDELPFKPELIINTIEMFHLDREALDNPQALLGPIAIAYARRDFERSAMLMDAYDSLKSDEVEAIRQDLDAKIARLEELL